MYGMSALWTISGIALAEFIHPEQHHNVSRASATFLCHHKQSYSHAVCSHSRRSAKLASVIMTHQHPETTALHAQVISFDVKPANVLLDRGGKHAKLADVGLAKVLEHSQTMTNMVGRPPG